MNGQDGSSGPTGEPKGRPEPGQRPEVRASDAEREALVERLNAATGEGRLDLDEFSERLELAYAARTRSELEALVEDLPEAGSGPATAPAPASAPAPVLVKGRTSWHVSPLGGLRRGGRWRVPADTLVVTLIGGVDLDLTEAELDAPVVSVRQFSLIGGADVLVPPGVRVEVSGFSILGGRNVEVDERATGPNAPLLRVTSFSILGGLRVHSTRSSSRSRGDYDELNRRREERRALHQERREARRDRHDRHRHH